MGAVTVKRPAKFGGDREFANYLEIETAYRNGEIHPLDLKKTVGNAMTEILSCVRDYVT
jgi:tyrosyl-tRNA synthetase